MKSIIQVNPKRTAPMTASPGSANIITVPMTPSHNNLPVIDKIPSITSERIWTFLLIFLILSSSLEKTPSSLLIKVLKKSPIAFAFSLS